MLFGDPETFGKQVGGDIIENKKTYLYLKALEFSTEEDQLKLSGLFNSTLEDNDTKISIVKQIFKLPQGHLMPLRKKLKTIPIRLFWS